MGDPGRPQESPNIGVRSRWSYLAVWRWRPRFSLRTLLILVLLAGSLMALIQRWDRWYLALNIPHPVARAVDSADEERTFCLSDFVLSQDHLVLAVMDETARLPETDDGQAGNPFCRELKHLESTLQVWHIASGREVSTFHFKDRRCYFSRDPGRPTVTVELRDHENRTMEYLELDPATGQTKPIPPPAASAVSRFGFKGGFWNYRDVGPIGGAVASGTFQQGQRIVWVDSVRGLRVVDGLTRQQIAPLPWPSGLPISSLKYLWFACEGSHVVFSFDPQPNLVWGTNPHEHQGWTIADADTGQSLRTILRAFATLSDDASLVAACSPEQGQLNLYSCLDGRLLYSVRSELSVFYGPPNISPDNLYVAWRSGLGIEVIEHRWPEGWWGILIRPEFLLAAGFLLALVWSVHKDRHGILSGPSPTGGEKTAERVIDECPSRLPHSSLPCARVPAIVNDRKDLDDLAIHNVNDSVRESVDPAAASRPIHLRTREKILSNGAKAAVDTLPENRTQARPLLLIPIEDIQQIGRCVRIDEQAKSHRLGFMFRLTCSQVRPARGAWRCAAIRRSSRALSSAVRPTPACSSAMLSKTSWTRRRRSGTGIL